MQRTPPPPQVPIELDELTAQAVRDSHVFLRVPSHATSPHAKANACMGAPVMGLMLRRSGHSCYTDKGVRGAAHIAYDKAAGAVDQASEAVSGGLDAAAEKAKVSRCLGLTDDLRTPSGAGTLACCCHLGC